MLKNPDLNAKPPETPLNGGRGTGERSPHSSVWEVAGRAFAPADRVPLTDWPCTTLKPQQSTLMLKDDDLFLITDTLGNISGCFDDHGDISLGLFCRDTRFLSRLELQIEGRLPVLLSSTAQRGFALSFLCANPYIENLIPAETISIQRDLVLQGGLFEELVLTNYGTQPISFELSLTFDADFADLFEIRGWVRPSSGTLLRRVRPGTDYGAESSGADSSGAELAGVEDAQSASAELAEIKSAGGKSAGATAAEIKSAGGKSAGATAAEIKSAGAKSVGEPSAGGNSAHGKSGNPEPAGTKSAGAKSAGATSAGATSVEGKSGNPESASPESASPGGQATPREADPLARAARDNQAIAQETNELVLAYCGLDDRIMEARIQFYRQPPDRFAGSTAIWDIALEPHETRTLGYRLQPFLSEQPASGVSIPATLGQATAAEAMEGQQWRDRITRIRTDNRSLNAILERAEQDIYLLGQTFGSGKILSAGVPWFATLFGRDAIIAAGQTLILDPTIARQTLLVLAEYQGQHDHDWREEAPGKILHELRLGEMARCGEIPHTPYYGTVDATPLWLLLYTDYYAWTGDRDLLARLWDAARAAMAWIDRQLKATGYLCYEQRSPAGLRNQGWKDSADCIVDRRGRIAEGSIALCEVQGYIYAAKQRLSEIARLKKRLDLADRWQEEAAALKERFQEDFWLPESGYLALALANGKPVDSITSNPGHCLGTGILSPDKARSVAERLQAPDLFSGWGIRTLSSNSPAYNPMGYHIGSVWPHDNGMIAAGLRSLGWVERSLEIAQGIFDMTACQPYSRPPELFCGYDRQPDSDPVRYPVACSPQAWASGSIFQLVQVMVNLVPDAQANCLRIVDPMLPESVQRLSLQNLPIGQTLLDLEFERADGVTACRVVRKRGNLRVVIEA